MSSIAVSWYDYDQRTLIFEFEGSWSMEQLFLAIDDVKALAISHHEQYMHISLIIDARNVTRLPIGNVARYQEIVTVFEGMMPHIVVVGANRLVTILTNTFARLTVSHIKLRLVNTIDEGVEILNEWADKVIDE